MILDLMEKSEIIYEIFYKTFYCTTMYYDEILDFRALLLVTCHILIKCTCSLILVICMTFLLGSIMFVLIFRINND